MSDRLTRRAFQRRLLDSAIVYGLLDTLWAGDAFAAEVKPIVGDWFKGLDALGQDLRGGKLKDVEFQAQMEALFRRVDLAELLKFADLEAVAKKKLPDNGASSSRLDLSRVEGLPAKLAFGQQIFGMKKGRSIVPHGHRNMCTGFVVLKGVFHGRHYDRVEDHDDHYIIRPTVDATFSAGGVSTISDTKDNVHWFESKTEGGYVFNVHVIGYDDSLEGVKGRLYLDPDGESVAGGLIRAPKMTSRECHRKYG